MVFVPRYFQTEAVLAVSAYMARNPGKSPLVAAPGGSGKSGMAAMLIHHILKSGKTVLYLTMSAPLVEQTFEHILKVSADTAARCSIACAELGKTSFKGAAVVGTAQSVIKHLDKLGGFAYIIVDEAHTIPRDPKSMYGKIFAACGAPIIHLSGTPWRMDSGLLHEGPGATADALVYQVPCKVVQDEGYIVRNRYAKAKVEIDASQIKLTRGEFNQREMEDIAMDMALCASMAKDIKARFEAEKRASCICFCVSIDHAEMMADQLRAIGMRAEAVSSLDGKADKRTKLKGFKLGVDIDVLCQVRMAGTGFDAPRVDMIAWATATNSAGFFTQGTWRGSRVIFAPGMPTDTPAERLAAIAAGPKSYCRVVDYGGNLFRHGVIEDIEKGGIAEAKKKYVKARTCPNIACEEIVSRTAEQCPVCGEKIFSHARALQQSKKASLDLIRGAWVGCEDYWFGIHTKAGSRDSLRITFRTDDGKNYAMWVSFEADSFTRTKSERRWKALGGGGPFPSSAASALRRAEGGELKKPYSVKLQKDLKSGFVGVADVDMIGDK